MYYTSQTLLAAATAARVVGNHTHADWLVELADLAATSPTRRVWLDRVI